MAMASYQIATALSSVRALELRVQDVSDTVDNWMADPIIDITLVPEGTNCPAGYSMEFDTSWRGTTGSYCVCPNTQSRFKSESKSCNATQYEYGCTMPLNFPSIPLKVIRGSQICAKRGGGDAMSRTILKKASQTCPLNHKKCGNPDGDYATTRTICFPEDVPCPITRVQFFSSLATMNAAGPWLKTEAFHNDSLSGPAYMALSSQDSGRNPLVDLRTLVGEKDYPCIASTKRQAYSDPSALRSASNKYGIDCSIGEDTRYNTRVAEESEQALLFRAFGRQAACASPQRDTTYIMAFRDANARCQNNDDICFDFFRVSICNKLLAYANSASASSSWQLVARPEIEWEASCRESKADVEKHLDPLNSLHETQKAMAIINIITNVFVGYIFPIIFILHVSEGRRDLPCVPGDDKAELLFIKRLKIYAGSTLKIVKLIPLLIAIIVAGAIKTFYSNVADSACSDPVTDSTLAWVGDQVPEIYSADVQLLVVDMIMIALDIIMLLQNRKHMASVLAEPPPQMQQPVQSAPPQGGAQPMVAQPMMAQAQPIVAQPMMPQAQPMWAQPMMAQPMEGQPMITGPPMIAQPIMGQPMMMGQPIMGQPMMMGQPIMGQPMMAQPQYAVAAVPSKPLPSQ